MKLAVGGRTKVFLGVSLLLLCMTLAIPSGKVQAPTASPPAAAAAEPTPPPEAAGPKMQTVDLHTQAAQQKRMALDWGPNPFVEKQTPEDLVSSQTPVQTDALQLKGISRTGEQFWAVIDTALVQKGDVLSTGHRVLSISEQRVVLEHEGKKQVLTLEETTREDR